MDVLDPDISACTGINTSGKSGVNIALIRGHLPEGGADLKSYIEYGMLVYANCSSQRMKGVTLAQGDTVVVYANSEHITFNLFGSEFNQTFDYDETYDYYGYGQVES
jgi:hypothetical protein